MTQTQGLTGLARLRGFGDRELERARVVAGALRLSSTVLTPGLMLAFAAMLRFRSPHGALVALGLAVLSVPYALLVGGSLALLGRACSSWLPGRGRLLLLSLVLGAVAARFGAGRAGTQHPGRVRLVAPVPGRELSLMQALLRAAAFGQLRDASLELSPGRYVVLSNERQPLLDLVALLAGSQPPRSGRVLLDGKSPASSPDAPPQDRRAVQRRSPAPGQDGARQRRTRPRSSRRRDGERGALAGRGRTVTACQLGPESA